MFSTFAPGGQVAGFTTTSSAAADQIWYQSLGRSSAAAACEKSTSSDLAAGWTQWAPSWEQWANNSKGGFVCSRQITWLYDSVPPSSSGSGPLTCATGSGAANTCIVGNTGPGGGIVFYVNEAASTGSRYMEAATADIAGTSAWCSITNGVIAGVETIISASSSVIGSGNANTDAMIAGGCTSGAANSVRAYGTATAPAGSWFLPSAAELDQLRSQRAVVGGFTISEYWSSSQSAARFAFAQYFGNGNQYDNFKYTLYNVRPVRAF